MKLKFLFKESERRQREKAMATHSSTLAWKIPWAEEPGRLQSMGSWRVGHDWATSLSLFCIGEGNGNPLQCSCLENPRDGGAWWTAVYGVTQSRTQLKRLSSSSSWWPGVFSLLCSISVWSLRWGSHHWTIVSSQSYFCWLYRASRSLPAKNIINLILVSGDIPV